MLLNTGKTEHTQPAAKDVPSKPQVVSCKGIECIELSFDEGDKNERWTISNKCPNIYFLAGYS
jgi:hypothetical protein